MLVGWIKEKMMVYWNESCIQWKTLRKFIHHVSDANISHVALSVLNCSS